MGKVVKFHKYNNHIFRFCYEGIRLWKKLKIAKMKLELFHQSTLMQSFLYSLTICLLQY